MFVLDGERVRFRSRYVRTDHYHAGLEGRGVPGRLVGTNRRGGWLGNVLRLPANVANTNVALHHGGLYALCEFGKPYRIDPDTLDTLGEHDFAGRLRRMGMFSAHFKIDPTSGELWNFGMEMFPRPTIRCYRLDRSGHLHTIGHVPIPDMVPNHDFALTVRHMVFALDPAVIDLPRALRFLLVGVRLADTVRWKPERGTTIVLVPRDGDRPRVVQTDAFFHFHVNNAYEEVRMPAETHYSGVCSSTPTSVAARLMLRRTRRSPPSSSAPPPRRPMRGQRRSVPVPYSPGLSRLPACGRALGHANRSTPTSRPKPWRIRVIPMTALGHSATRDVIRRSGTNHMIAHEDVECTDQQRPDERQRDREGIAGH